MTTTAPAAAHDRADAGEQAARRTRWAAPVLAALVGAGAAALAAWWLAGAFQLSMGMGAGL